MHFGCFYSDVQQAMEWFGGMLLCPNDKLKFALYIHEREKYLIFPRVLTLDTIVHFVSFRFESHFKSAAKHCATVNRCVKVQHTHLKVQTIVQVKILIQYYVNTILLGLHIN